MKREIPVVPIFILVIMIIGCLGLIGLIKTSNECESLKAQLDACNATPCDFSICEACEMVATTRVDVYAEDDTFDHEIRLQDMAQTLVECREEEAKTIQVLRNVWDENYELKSKLKEANMLLDRYFRSSEQE